MTKTIEERVDLLETKLKSVYDVMNEAIVQGRNLLSTQTKLNAIDEALSNIQRNILTIQKQQKTMLSVNKKEYAPEEMAKLYMASGLTLKDIKSAVQQALPKKEITEQSIYAVIHGKAKDLEVSSFLGNYLLQNVN